MGDIVTPIEKALRAHAPVPLHTRIRIERVLADLSVRHCARAMGISHTLWQEIEAGKRAVADDEVKAIAKIVGCTPARLRGEQAVKTPGFRKMGRPRGQAAA
jgi:transcriptional regulator with XRE-family HTH domain